MVHEQSWVSYDESKCSLNEIEIALQVNGKIRSRLMIPVDASQEEVLTKAKADPKISGEISGKTVVKEIYVKGKLVNIVVK